MAENEKKTLFDELKEDLIIAIREEMPDEQLNFKDFLVLTTLCGLVDKKIAEAKEEIIQAVKEGCH